MSHEVRLCSWDALLLDQPGTNATADPAAASAAAAAPPPSKRARKRAREEHEASVRQAELSRLRGEAPQTPDDFERLALGAPNSSYVWIQYVVHLLGTAEVAKARAVAERALETIDFRCGSAVTLHRAAIECSCRVLV